MIENDFWHSFTWVLTALTDSHAKVIILNCPEGAATHLPAGLEQGFVENVQILFSFKEISLEFALCFLKGNAVEFVNQDEQSRKWLNEFRAKSYAKPISFEQVEGRLAIAVFHNFWFCMHVCLCVCVCGAIN